MIKSQYWGKEIWDGSVVIFLNPKCWFCGSDSERHQSHETSAERDRVTARRDPKAGTKHQRSSRHVSVLGHGGGSSGLTSTFTSHPQTLQIFLFSQNSFNSTLKNGFQMCSKGSWASEHLVSCRGRWWTRSSTTSSSRPTTWNGPRRTRRKRSHINRKHAR